VSSPSAISKRKPLSHTARRAGRVGCNIALNRVPAKTRIAVVTTIMSSPRSSAGVSPAPPPNSSGGRRDTCATLSGRFAPIEGRCATRQRFGLRWPSTVFGGTRICKRRCLRLRLRVGAVTSRHRTRARSKQIRFIATGTVQVAGVTYFLKTDFSNLPLTVYASKNALLTICSQPPHSGGLVAGKRNGLWNNCQ